MAIHPLAGKTAPAELLIDANNLQKQYFERKPNPADPGQLVIFGTSGHRGTPGEGTFTETHILAIAQAICDYRRAHGIDGPIFVGKDTHALSEPAQQTALEVLAANEMETCIQPAGGSTPIPAVSRAILRHNCSGEKGQADGIVISPSHNPPGDGGIKYNPPNGGPADTDVTTWIQDRANELLRAGNAGVKRTTSGAAMRAATTHEYDFILPYVRELGQAIDMEAIRGARLRLGADPLGGASLDYWAPINEIYGLDIEVVNTTLDPAFGFMPVDHDGKIRMDCSSPYAMAKLVGLKDRFDVAFGNDPDADRHGIVTPTGGPGGGPDGGLMNPNHYLAVAVRYLLRERPAWRRDAAVGKTLVSSSMIDRVVESENRQLREVPVGFKWFAQGLFEGSLCFGGEESAGASFLQKDGSVWTTDKDGPLMDLLAAEITAKTGMDPAKHYQELTGLFGTPQYRRVDLPATREQKQLLKKLRPDAITQNGLAGEPILAKLTRAPGNGAEIGGLKVTANSGWFAVRPSGTENILKIYAESFQGTAHLDKILNEAREIVGRAVGAGE